MTNPLWLQDYPTFSLYEFPPEAMINNYLVSVKKKKKRCEGLRRQLSWQRARLQSLSLSSTVGPFCDRLSTFPQSHLLNRGTVRGPQHCLLEKGSFRYPEKDNV